MKRTAVVLALVGSVATASAQSAQVTFDAASIKTSGASDRSVVVPGVFLPDGRWSAQRATLSMLLRSAYDLPASRVIGLPSWTHSQRFDISTTAAPDIPAEQLRTMAQRLLADRFDLHAHWEQQEMDVYALVRADVSGALGPGLRRSNVACPRGIVVTGESGGPPPSSACSETIRLLDDAAMQFHLRDRSLSEFLVLSGARSEIGDPVADRTGLDGKFDIDIEFAYRSLPQLSALAIGVPLAAAVVPQLGLRFERRTELVSVLVVDSVEMPTSN